MLISYENDVIPIPKEIQRSFQDDPPHIPAVQVTESAKKTKGSIKRSLIGNPKIKALQEVENDQSADPSSPSEATAQQDNSVSNGADSVFQQKEHARFGKKEISGRLHVVRTNANPVDQRKDIADYKAFNAYFYRDLRNLKGDVVEHNPKKETGTLFLRQDHPKGELLMQDIVEFTAPLQEGENGASARNGALIPVPDKLDDPNALRNGEASSWDTRSDARGRFCQKEAAIQPFQWITHGNFSVHAAIENLEEFFQKEWKRDACWRYNIELLTKKHRPGPTTTYIFESCWSIPTRKAPVPTATASIYFTIDVCDVLRPEAPVVVKCHYENSPMIRDPQTINFGQDMLIDIMKRKQILAERLIY
ncbi:uncharacterized protein LOC129585478 [Paramacrobiotus metropolitanus]|uniref:uncharacterized protein LOC129585478 n=1 Tax=Paramacrobiotus metropolitanus TaxID=2943436 RepID=UPI0024458D6B|nr:uncharacterized protein LOC129585478 [Paramacrobiotus metropolitanus]